MFLLLTLPFIGFFGTHIFYCLLSILYYTCNTNYIKHNLPYPEHDSVFARLLVHSLPYLSCIYNHDINWHI